MLVAFSFWQNYFSALLSLKHGLTEGTLHEGRTSDFLTTVPAELRITQAEVVWARTNQRTSIL